MSRLGLLLLSCLLFSNLVRGQHSDQAKLQEAKVFFSHQRYAEALSILAGSRQLSRFDKEARFLIAVCQYQTNQLDEAYQTLTSLTEEAKPPYPECWLYLAKVYHAQHRFREAGDHYKTYLRSIFPNDPKRRMVIEEIRRCANGIELQFQATSVFAENLGPQVNTSGDEFAPIASPSYADRIYFSAIRPQNTGGARDAYGNPDPQWGNYYSDLFQTRVVQGRWAEVNPMHYLLNSPKHEVLLGFGADGQALYYFKGWNLQRGEIVVDTFRKMEERILSSTPLPGPVRPELGDNYPVFYRDTLVIFASSRRGGYGGWDLYKARKQDGRWLLPENLGATVNTAYDETTPFLANDGQTLYFSSNDSKKSIGGLDVFKTLFIPERNRWLPPQNVGMPINSAADDEFFKIARDGFTAYFASSRKDGLGQRDIYAAVFQDFLPEMEFPPNYFAQNQLTPSPDENIVSQGRSEEAPPAFEPTRPAETTDLDASPSRRLKPAATGNSKPVNISTTPTPTPKENNAFTPIVLEGNSVAPSQYDLLDRLSVELIRRQDLRLVITAFHGKGGPTGIVLFDAIKKAEAVAGYLQAKGVSREQLFMRGALVEAINEVSGQVDLAFTTDSGRDPGGDLPVIGVRESGRNADLIINEPLHYKVQVASTKKPLREAYLEGFADPMIEKTPDFPYYRYTLGAFTERSAAERFRKKMQANGRTSAFLATYRQGWRVKR